MTDKEQKGPSAKSITILVLASILTAIFLIEAMASLFPQFTHPVITKFFFEEDLESVGYVGDEVLGFKYAPDLVDFPIRFEDDSGQPSGYSITTVSLGYEGVGFRDDGIDGEPYAVVIGDSFTTCFGVPAQDCWVEILEEDSGRDFANLGVGGYGPQQMERMLDQYGLPLNPSLVVWVFFANDPFDAWHFDQFGRGEAKEGKFWKIPFSRWLVQHTLTGKLLAFSWFNRRLFYYLVFGNEENAALTPDLSWWQTITDPANPYFIEGLRRTQQIVLRAQRQLRDRSEEAEFVLVIIPAREQIYAKSTRLQVQLDAMNKEIVDFARQHDIAIIDLTPAVRDAAPTEPFLYMKRDFHLNAEGYEVIARLLQEKLHYLLKDDGHSN